MDGVSGSPYTFTTIMSDGQLEKLAAVSPSIDDDFIKFFKRHLWFHIFFLSFFEFCYRLLALIRYVFNMTNDTQIRTLCPPLTRRALSLFLFLPLFFLLLFQFPFLFSFSFLSSPQPYLSGISNISFPLLLP